MIRVLPSSLAVSLLLLTNACGDSSSTGSGGTGATGAGGDGAGGAGPADCPAGDLCLDVEHEGEAAGRLAVVWFRQLVTGTLTDPVVGFEEPFDPEADELTVDLGAITEPPDALLFCDRACAEPIECVCEPGFAAGVGYVVVVVDEDANGIVNPEDLANEENIVGIANVAMVFAPMTVADAPAPFNETFPDGVKAGIAPYRINSDGAFEPSSAGSRFTLKVGPNAF